MATPHVAGVAALIRSRFPGASADDTVGAILDGVDPIAELSGKTATGGRLNAAASMVPSLRPNAVATATPISGDIPLTVTFDGSESTDPGGTIESYEWSFSDGPSAVGEIVERTFMASGTVTASLVVTDNDGNQDSHEVAVNVNAPPVAAPRANPSLGIVPLLVTLDGSNSIDPDGTIESYEWDLGNGVHRTGSTVLHDFEDTGVHSVELTVIDDFGSSSSQSMEVLVGFAFTDITASVFGLDIAWLSATGITKGCNPPSNNQFCPNANVTRGQMAAFLARGLGLTDRLNDPFTDDDNSIFEADIEKLAAAGITKGCNPPANDMFCPDSKVTRGQMAAFLVRALGYVDDGGGNLFIDDDDSIFEGDIDKLGTAGVTKGCNPPTNNMYCPDGFVTRGQMAAFLHRALG
jgi:PKD repeat protein